MRPELEQRILACRTLPSLPVAALEILAQSRERNVDLGRMAGSLSSDPVLASRVVRAANAAAFGWGEVTSVPRAVTLLGANRVLCVALTFSLVGIRRQGERDGFDHGAFWSRSLHAAVAARALAERARLDADEAFLGGLVQDIGMLALAETLGPSYGALVKGAHGDHRLLAEREAEKLGESHPEVTALLTRRWHFPARLQDAAGGSHTPPTAPKLDLHGCVHLSGPLADIWAPASAARGLDAALDAAPACGLDRDALSAVLVRVGALIPDVEGELQVTLASESERERVLSEAHQALHRLRHRDPRAEPGEA